MIQLLSITLAIMLIFGLIYLSHILIGVTLIQALGVSFVVMGGLSIIISILGKIDANNK